MEAPRDYLEAIINRTRELRRKANFTQEQMAALLDVPRNTYAHYERIGTERISILPLNLIPQFCELTGVSLHFFLTGREHPLLAAYGAISGQDKIIVDRFLRLSQDAALDPLMHTGVCSDEKPEHR